MGGHCHAPLLGLFLLFLHCTGQFNGFPNITNPSINGTFNGTLLTANCSIINMNCSNITIVPPISCSRCRNGRNIRDIFDLFKLPFTMGNETPGGVKASVDDLRILTRQLLDESGSLESDELDLVGYALGKSVQYFRDSRFLERSALDSLVDTFSDILEPRNREGWQGMSAASLSLLTYAENCGRYMSEFLSSSTPSVLISKPNIVFKAAMVSDEDDVFPSAADLVNSTVNTINNKISGMVNIPKSLITSVREKLGDNVQIVHILMNSLQDFLPTEDVNGTIATVIVSTEVSGVNSSTLPAFKEVLRTQPITLEFNISSDVYNSTGESGTATCVSMNENGQWVSDGIRTEKVNDRTVRCESTHLTSFCVLVDVSGTTADNLALSIVSYIGCAISLLCLIVTVIFLLSLGKTLFTEVYSFIHLNLALALLIGLIVFVAGIETAASNDAACKAVAFMLHYFFLAAFCWMLCEGFMLYLMLVVVFSKLIKKWWIYLIFGWGLPLIPPAVTLGIRFDNYTTTQSFCWLGTESGTIWGFVGPMLLIIAVNLVIMVIIVGKLLQVRWRRNQHKKKTTQNVELVSDLVKGVIVLLPLLGLTWLFGLFAVNENTLVFAWLFTIFNSLQGVFIFIFHVVKSKRVWGRLQKWYKKKRGLPTSSIVSRSTSVSIREQSSLRSLNRGSINKGESFAGIKTTKLATIQEPEPNEVNGTE